jgi:hypothetical protein
MYTDAIASELVNVGCKRRHLMRFLVRQFPNHGCFIPAQYLRFPDVVHGSQRGAGVLHRTLHFFGDQGRLEQKADDYLSLYELESCRNCLDDSRTAVCQW